MPGDVRRRPCLVTPYHYRLDWQMWFVGNDAARGEDVEEEPWLVHLVWQLLAGRRRRPKRLFARDPFPRIAAAVDSRGPLALPLQRVSSRRGVVGARTGGAVPGAPLEE